MVDSLIPVTCNCDCGTICPQGKIGTSSLCTIMVAAPTSGSRMGREARRLVLFDRAKDAMGGARKLGEIIGVGRRSVNNKLNAERRLTDFELSLTAEALDAKAREFDQLVADIRKVLP